MFLDDDDLAEMERLADMATPGEWTVEWPACLPDAAAPDGMHVLYGVCGPNDGTDVVPVAYEEDARHIASCSPDRIKALIAEVRRLRAEVERMRPVVEALVVWDDALSPVDTENAYCAVLEVLHAYRTTDSRPTDGAKGEG